MIPLTSPSLLSSEWSEGKGGILLGIDYHAKLLVQRVRDSYGYEIEGPLQLNVKDMETFWTYVLVAQGRSMARLPSYTDENKTVGWQSLMVTEHARRHAMAGNWEKFGEKIDNSWMFDWGLLKTGKPGDDIYARARSLGAYGGRWQAEGLVLIVPPDKRQAVSDYLNKQSMKVL